MFGSWNPSQYKFFNWGTSITSTLIKLSKGFCGLQGILCATSSSLIIVVYDTLTTDTDPLAVQVTGQITLTAGQSYPIPAKINQGLYIKGISGTGTFTVFFD